MLCNTRRYTRVLVGLKSNNTKLYFPHCIISCPTLVSASPIDVRGIIVGRYIAGDSPKKIAEEEKVDIQRVYAYIRKYETTQNLNDQPKPGRPRKFNDRDRRAVLRDISNLPFDKPIIVANRQTKQMSKSTVYRIGHENGIHRR